MHGYGKVFDSRKLVIFRGRACRDCINDSIRKELIFDR